MKKVYEAPKVEIEIYELDASIASNCAVVVTVGDYGGDVSAGETACNDYLERVESTYSARKAYNVNFWENTCDCYTTAGGEGYFTS